MTRARKETRSALTGYTVLLLIIFLVGWLAS